MQSKASTVRAYLASLPADRRKAIEAVRAVILKNLDKKIEEGMQYGMIGYFVPHSVFPAGYHCDPKQPLPFAGLASQKQHMSFYLMGCYAEPTFHRWFTEAWKATGKRLDMGKACIRFKSIDEVPLEVVAEAVRRLTLDRYLATYLAALPANKRPTSPDAAKAVKSGVRAASKKVIKKATSKVKTKASTSPSPTKRSRSPRA
ncbi:MAG: DUF1801 domain-containing protein [Phycisphaerae bacterium]|jgi:hypothetical protein|nr:DUF1801 domain-containing protein [Phycisphaerae bacterium]